MARNVKPKTPKPGHKKRSVSPTIHAVPRSLAAAKKLGFAMKKLDLAEFEELGAVNRISFVQPKAWRGHIDHVDYLQNGHWLGVYRAADGSIFTVASADFPKDDV